MKIWVILFETSQPILHEDVTNTFQKGEFYCVYVEATNLVYKYPLGNIFRVVEEYEGEIYKTPPGGKK